MRLKLLFLTAIISFSLTSLSAKSADKRPNIIVILADDMGYNDAGYMGCAENPTPNIDALAESGVWFTEGYTTCPVCVPGRTGLITGRYQNRFDFEDHPGPYRQTKETVAGIPLREKTMGEYFKELGYRTALIGKWHTDRASHMNPANRGFDKFFGFINGACTYYIGNNEKGKLLRGETPVLEENEYLTDAFGREAIHFLENHKEDKFFLYLSFNAVHTPLKATYESLAKFSHIADENRRTMLAMNYVMDKNIGKVMDKLGEPGLEENTLVFFYSDNGGYPGKNYSENTPFRGGKTQMWEGGIRIPFAISWIGQITPGRNYNETVCAFDILPTVLGMQNTLQTNLPTLDGVDLLPYINGAKGGSPHSTLYWRQNKQWAIQQGNWKLIKPKGQDEMELFDLSVDKEEQNDIAGSNADRVSNMLAKHEGWASQMMEPQWGWQKGIDGDYKKE